MRSKWTAPLLLAGAMLISLIGPAAHGPLAFVARDNPPGALADNPNPPATPVKLIFIHHSTGENWLADDNGRLGLSLRDNNYFVSDTNYGWGPDSIGDTTDIGHWWTWFRGPRSAVYTAALYAESGQHSSYSRLPTDPGGENEIITAPPLVEGDTDAAHAANARAFNNWLVNDWLDGYPYDNVAVFDFYNVLTSNGGDRNTNDLGWEAGNHHRWWHGAVQHIQTVDNNFAAYGNAPWDSHPTAAGGQKASGEFIQLLNIFYHRWKESEATPTSTATSALPTPTRTGEPTARLNTPTPTATGMPSAYLFVYLPFILKNWSAPLPTPTPTATAVIPSGLLQPSDLAYLGGFAFPAGDEWAYSGHALAYYPQGDPAGPADGYPGSLYAAGHTWNDLVGEIAIPAPVIADDFDRLPKASVLRPLTDITGGWKDNCTYADDCIYREVDGLEYLPNVRKIAWNLRDWYNVAGYDQDSLGWSELDMSGAQGVWHIGDRPSANNEFHNAKTCNYLFKAPESFADRYLDGKWLIAGNHREAGAFGGSQGPTLYALAPWEDGNPPAPGQNLDALALVYYPVVNDCLWNDPGACLFPGYRARDDWGGGAWVQTPDKSGILIFGRKALGDNCYGTPEECGGDPCDPYKGYHGYPYEPQILFYDPGEVIEVIAGTREPWEVVPYAVHSVENEMFGGECAVLGAVAYDQDRQLIYVTEQEAGPWEETVVHVWSVR